MSQLPALVGVFAYLSLLTVGGGLAAFPEMKALTVERFHWLTLTQLIHLYSLGQVAPGPNMMMVAAVLEGWRWRASIQRGLAPVSIGLLVAGAISLAKGAIFNWIGVIIAVVVFALLLGTRINPALLVLCGAGVGLFVFGGR